MKSKEPRENWGKARERWVEETALRWQRAQRPQWGDHIGAYAQPEVTGEYEAEEFTFILKWKLKKRAEITYSYFYVKLSLEILAVLTSNMILKLLPCHPYRVILPVFYRLLLSTVPQYMPQWKMALIFMD